MDWKRVKTILIIALLFVNGLLAYTLYQDRKVEETGFLDRDLVIELLAEHDVYVEEGLFDAEVIAPNISLILQSYDLNTIQDTFDEVAVYEDKDISANTTFIVQNKELNYTTSVNDVNLSTHTLSEDVVIENAKSLVETLGFSKDDLYIKDIGHTGKKMIINFGQTINGHALIDAYTTVKYNNNQLLEFTRVWYDVIETYEIETADFSTEYALYRFVGQISHKQPNRKKSLTIEDIQLVYKLSLEETIEGLDGFALEGDATIYWEITTSDQKSYLEEAMID